MRLFFLSLFTSIFLIACGSASETAQTKKPGKSTDNTALKRLFVDANKARLLDKPEEAEGLFLECLKRDPNHHASMYELARLAMKSNNIESALHFAGQASKLDKGNQWYQSLYARLLVESGQEKEALPVFKQMITNDPENPERYYELAARYAKAGMNKDAVQLYDQLEKKFGKQQEILDRKHSLYVQQGNVDGQIEVLEDLIEINNGEPRYYAMLSDAYLTKGDNQNAERVLQKLSALKKDDPQLLLALAEIHRKNNKPKSFFEKTQKAFEDSTLGFTTKVSLQLSLLDSIIKPSKHKAEVLDLSRTIMTVHPKDARAQAQYGDFLFYADQNENARSAYLRALDIDQSRFSVWQNLFYCDNRLTDNESLLKHCSEAMNIFPNQAQVYLFKGLAQNALKEYDGAIKTLKQGSLVASGADARTRADIYSLLGDAYHSKKEHPKSDEAYDKSLQIDPNNVFVLNNYSYYLSLRKDKLDDALNMIKKAVELSPNNKSFMDTYGWVLFQKGDYKNAKEWIGKALERSPNDAEVLEHMGDVEFKLGNKKEALKKWRAAKSNGSSSKTLDQKISEENYIEN